MTEQAITSPARPQITPPPPAADRTAQEDLLFAVTLYRLGRELARENARPEAVLQALLARLVERFRADTGSLALREEGGRWRLACGIGLPAQALGLEAAERKPLHYAALLHDLGKLAWPEALLGKPFNLLAGEERAIAIGHPLAAETLLAGLAPLAVAARLIRSHHERYDGLGYPQRLGGEEIPLGARILAVAEDDDELQQGWLLPERLSAEQARDFIRAEAGRRYDPVVVEAFLDTWRPPAAVQAGERRLPWSALRSGMRLSRPLKAKNGLVLLPAGTVLMQAHLDRLRAIAEASGGLGETYVHSHAAS
jgi:response regulator RpfG family c-di-GMP phosphodiesterase